MKDIIRQFRDAYREAFSKQERASVLVFVLSVAAGFAALYFWPFARPSPFGVCAALILAGGCISLKATFHHMLDPDGE